MERIYQHINTMGNSSSDLSSSLSNLNNKKVIVEVTLPATEGGAFGLTAKPIRKHTHELEYTQEETEGRTEGRYMVFVKGEIDGEDYKAYSRKSYEDAKYIVNGWLNDYYTRKYDQIYNYPPRIYSTVTWDPVTVQDSRGVEHQFRRLHKS